MVNDSDVIVRREDEDGNPWDVEIGPHPKGTLFALDRPEPREVISLAYTTLRLMSRTTPVELLRLVRRSVAGSRQWSVWEEE